MNEHLRMGVRIPKGAGGGGTVSEDRDLTAMSG